MCEQKQEHSVDIEVEIIMIISTKWSCYMSASVDYHGESLLVSQFWVPRSVECKTYKWSCPSCLSCNRRLFCGNSQLFVWNYPLRIYRDVHTRSSYEECSSRNKHIHMYESMWLMKLDSTYIFIYNNGPFWCYQSTSVIIEIMRQSESRLQSNEWAEQAQGVTAHEQHTLHIHI